MYRHSYRYTQRCCPWTAKGFGTVGDWCHDLPEGATCTEKNQCQAFPKQRPQEGGPTSHDGTDDPRVPGLFCGESPIHSNTERHKDNVWAQYDPKTAIEQGSRADELRHHDREWMTTQYNYSSPQDWDPSNLVKKCTKVLLPGEPCCDSEGCHDWMCGPAGAHWGVGWVNMEQDYDGMRGGKCGVWGGDSDAHRFPNADGSPNNKCVLRPAVPTHTTHYETLSHIHYTLPLDISAGTRSVVARGRETAHKKH